MCGGESRTKHKFLSQDDRLKKKKNDGMISVHFQGKLFSITVIQVYDLTSNGEEVEVEQFYEDL